MVTEIHSTNGRKFLYRKVASKIRRMIDEGVYRPGEKVPSVRELSRQLKVGINTVIQAYGLLESARVIQVRPQSGYFVRSRFGPGGGREGMKKATAGLTATAVTVGQVYLEVTRDMADERLVPLGRSTPNPELLPVDKLNRVLAGVGRRFSSMCAAYAPAGGLDRLRVQIAKRSLDYGCSLSPDQIMVTSGCVEAVTLAIQATCRAGDTVVVESPVYCIFLKFMEWMGLKVLEIPSTPCEGMSLDVLEYVLRHNTVRACMIISNFSNPLGGLMPEEKKRQLVRLLAKHEIPLIEDDIYGDLGFGPSRPSVFKAYDDQGLVILCSSFSKTLAPGYRVGWIVPGRYEKDIAKLKPLFNIATATPTQLAIADFLSGAGYDRHLRAIRRTLSRKAGQMRECVLDYFPAGTKVSTPAGGYFLWVEMPEGTDSYGLYRRARSEGIGIAPGMLFSLGDGFKNCIRLNVSFWSPPIEQALKTVGRLAGR